MKNEITFLVVSCDKYSDLWKPFFHCFFKYWPDCPYKIHLVTNKLQFQDTRVTSINIGDDQAYSTNLFNILDQIKTDWLIFWYDDAFISSKVDTDYFLKIVNLAQSKDVGSLKISVDYPWVYSKNSEEIIAPIPMGVKYRSALGMSLYQKSIFREMLVPGKSAWELDKMQCSSSIKDSFYALTVNSLSKPPIEIQHMVVKGKWEFSAPNFLLKEGLEEYTSSRKRQSLIEYFYSNLYQLRLMVYKKLGLNWYD